MSFSKGSRITIAEEEQTFGTRASNPSPDKYDLPDIYKTTPRPRFARWKPFKPFDPTEKKETKENLADKLGPARYDVAAGYAKLSTILRQASWSQSKSLRTSVVEDAAKQTKNIPPTGLYNIE